MSSLHHTIDIDPPKYGDKVEKMMFSNYICPVCNGAKQFLDQTGRNELKKTTCPCCDGTGKVKAEIVVKWSPDYNS